MQAPVRQRGVAIVYASVFMVTLIGIVSLAVDWGRVQTAKTELRDATDAAARYAVTGIVDSTTLTKAQAAASSNTVDGTALALTSADVEVGTWDGSARTFTVSATNQNAVRITGRRTAARGTAVPLVFAKAIGRQTCDVTAVSVASQNAVGVVGVSSLTLNTTGTIKRTSSEGTGVAVASNGTFTFGGGSNTVTGDAFYAGTAPGANVAGRQVLVPSFSYPTVSAPGTYTAKITGDAYVNTAGTYSGVYVVTGNWYCQSGGILTLNGNLDVYVAGNVNFSGTFKLINNGYKLRTFLTGSGTVSVSCSNNLTMLFYAPSSAVTYAGTGTIVGSVVGSTLTIKAPMEYSSTLPIPFDPVGGGPNLQSGGVWMVK